ncbi:receptor-type tyrosine-protein kinase FLT3 isoform X2 [Ictalurus punctatus]|uniref:receptor protein-tyrosine kinase n=1 Tax=Ictalurus punctatus TaxID=7998 RepID=A0A2D0PV94_ICTPU|nr:receptor-type tyrosine-protein kinase FLT3 isoform X2 [Ictalurus punctatus]
MLLCAQTMQLRQDTLLMVFLLLEFSAFVCSETLQQMDMRDGHWHRLPCVSEKTIVRCKLSEVYLQDSQTTLLEVVAGQMVEIHLRSDSLENSTRCFWEQRGMSNLLLSESFERGMDGIYTVFCGDSKAANISVRIQSEKRPSVPQLTVNNGEDYSVYFLCASEGNPQPTIMWYENEKRISPEEIKNTENEVTKSKLSSFNYHSSNIKCCATNSHGEECSYIYLYDLDSAMLNSEAPQILLRPGQSLSLQCNKMQPDDKNKKFDLKWYFNNQTELKGVSSSYYSRNIEYYSIASVNEKDSGEYRCTSSHGQAKAIKVQVLENDLLEILKLNKHVTIQDKDKANFCFHIEVLSHPKAQCHWITPRGTIVQCDTTQYLWGKSTFTLCNPEPGQYQIQLRAGRKVVTESMSLCVTDTPKFLLLQDLAQVTCMTKSVFPVNVSWMTCPSNADFRDPSVWKQTYADTTEYSDSEQFCQKNVVVSRPLSDVNDHFVKCCNNNNNNNTVSYCSEQILVKIASANSLSLVVICSLLVFALMLVSVLLFHFIRKKKPGYKAQIQMIQMVGPSDNDYIYIDFKDFKYNQKLEFPRENLELGKELGSGAFGMVVQATAYGISKPGVSMQVAVKMLKEKHQTVEKEALMSELKMLTYIGHHVNIVNLLGACTGTGPIYLIFQFCHHGDLLNYLKNNREHFYKSLTDAFNKDRFSSLYNSYQRKRNSSDFVQSGDNPYVPMAPVNKEQEALLSSTDINEDIFENEDEEDHQTLTYEDLLSFSYQVAKGMEFLSCKNCIHRDLAARNILVTRSRLVKIGDFGLARDIENDSNYVVRGNARLPVKWMAPESIFKGMYTMQSDVWSYGILLWEIFSLGVTPYPGIKVDNTFYALIERGFQMERPYYASEAVYKVMCRCWALEPKDRPCFSKLVAFMEFQLSDFEERLYYNIKGQKNCDSVYQNTPVTSEPPEILKEDAVQSSVTDSSCDTETNHTTTQLQEDMEIITYH